MIILAPWTGTHTFAPRAAARRSTLSRSSRIARRCSSSSSRTFWQRPRARVSTTTSSPQMSPDDASIVRTALGLDVDAEPDAEPEDEATAKPRRKPTIRSDLEAEIVAAPGGDRVVAARAGGARAVPRPALAGTAGRMIVRDQGGSWQVVLQTDHADLSGAVAEAWVDRGPRHDSLVVAARRHDDGWAVWERSPLVGDGGAPVGFLDVHVPGAPRVLPGGHRGRHGRGSLRRPPRLDARRGHLPAALRRRHRALAFACGRGAAARRRLRRGAGVGVSRSAPRRSASTRSSAGPTTTGCSGSTASRSRSACASGTSPTRRPFELGTFTFTPLGPWRAKVEPYPFAGTSASFTLLRRLLPARPWTQAEFRRDFSDTEPAAVEIELVA